MVEKTTAAPEVASAFLFEPLGEVPVSTTFQSSDRFRVASLEFVPPAAQEGHGALPGTLAPAAVQPDAASEEKPQRPRSPAHYSRGDVCDLLASAAQEHDLPAPFFTSLIWQESRFDPKTVSRVGAQGIAQFMPGTASEFGLSDPFDVREALPTSARMLRGLFDKFGNLGLAAAAYNAGPGRVANWLAKRASLPQETRTYVLRITGRPAEHWRGRTVRTVAVKTKAANPAPCPGVSSFAEALNAKAETAPVRLAAVSPDKDDKSAKSAAPGKVRSRGGRQTLVLAIRSAKASKATARLASKRKAGGRVRYAAAN